VFYPARATPRPATPDRANRGEGSSRGAERNHPIVGEMPADSGLFNHCVSNSNSFWAGGEETAANGFLNECKRVLGFAGLRLGCLRTELCGPYLIFSSC
jgi:hypothetical protein